MSFNDNPDLLTKSWAPYQTNLIYLVKKYPITYQASPTRQTKLYKARWDAAWIEIGRQLCQPSKTCKQVWTNIKFKYAKIVNLINTGKISKEAALSHPESSKFFDGQLSFMDTFVCKITDENIPFRIHKSINDLFCLKTKRIEYVSHEKSYTQLVTHAQVKALLRERQSKEEPNSDIMNKQYLQFVVDSAVKRKLDELLQKTDDLSNPNDDTTNNINVIMTPSKDFRNIHKRKPKFTLVPSKNIPNNDEEDTTKTLNLGLQTELIIEDDIKSEAEDNNIKMEDGDHIKEENVTLDNNINNTMDENYDLEHILPSTQIPAVHNTMKNTNIMNNDVTAIEYKIDNNAMMDSNETPITDDYIRNFFNELGIVMSLELSISKQKILKSRINELLKDIISKEESREGHKGGFTSLSALSHCRASAHQVK